MSESAIETSGLTCHFGPIRAVDGLCLKIQEGSVYGFLGPNGAGKTTTIRMLLGLVRPTRGTATILGRDIVRERAQILREISAVVEAPAFYPFLTGYENLQVIARTADDRSERRIGELLGTVRLAERAHQKVKGYSLGMKQRLAIASVLLSDPKIIFLDEPTNGLDPAGAAEVRELIQQLRANGRTIFLSSHLLHEVEHICTDVAIINRGKLVEEGPVAMLLQREKRLRVKASPPGILFAVAERFDARAERAGEDTAILELSPEYAPELTAALVEAGAKVFHLSAEHASLESLFLRLTGGTLEDMGTRTTRGFVWPLSGSRQRKRGRYAL